MANARRFAKWSSSAAAALFMAAPHSASAVQPLHSDKPAAAIVDSDVRQEEALSRTEAGKVITAIERTRDNIGTVRKTTKLDTVDIVFLTDAARSEGGPPPAIENKVKQHQEDVAELRELLSAWREAKSSVWKSAIGWLTRLLGALLLAGIAMRLGMEDWLK